MWFIVNPKSILEESQLNPNIKNENENYVLSLNDIIKLGRVKFAITDVNINGSLKSIVDSNSNPIFNFILDYDTNINDEEICCIYCLENDSANGPLINICKCSISMSVHYECIKKWINRKLIVYRNKSGNVISYIMKSFNCTICKSPYPCKHYLIILLVRLRRNNIINNLIDYLRPQGKNYIILESLDQLKEGNNSKSIHIITLEDNKKITFGRGQEADIKIYDISVSRMHGAISLVKDKKILLQDLGSKFGTLVLLQKRIFVGNKKISLQIGRSYIEAKSIPNSMNIVYKDEIRRLEIKNE